MSVASNPIQQVTNEDEILPQRWLLIILIIIKLQSFFLNFQGGSYQASCCEVGGIKKSAAAAITECVTPSQLQLLWLCGLVQFKDEKERLTGKIVLRIFTVCHSKLNFRLSLLGSLRGGIISLNSQE